MPGKEHYRDKLQQPTQGNTYKKMFPFIRGYLFQYKKIKVIKLFSPDKIDPF
ncbi:MAG: hypothetical protein ABIU77_25770 [Ferruginibacter sp.]